MATQQTPTYSLAVRQAEYNEHAARILRRAADILTARGWHAGPEPFCRQWGTVNARGAILAAARTQAGWWYGSDPPPVSGLMANFAATCLEADRTEGRSLEWWNSRQRGGAAVAEAMREVADRLELGARRMLGQGLEQEPGE